MAEAPRLGFIGLGLMGQGFTKRLTSRGFAVTAYDLDAAKVETATAHGVIAAGSPAEVAAASDIVMTCVTTTDAVHAVVFGENGIATVGPAASKVLVDFSTTVVETTKAMATRLRDETGMGWVDAPVSGGPTAAEGGSLAIMAGGSDADFAAVSPVLGTLAGVLTHMGPVGAGQITKMINQVLVLNNYVILAEALALAEAGGIDASKVPAALASGHAGSNLLNAQFPRMIARDYAPLGYMRQVLKDLDMVHDMAKGLKVPTPMSATSAEMFRTLVNKGFGEIDGIAVLKLYDPKD
jgi:3-hydroxyisobutyrate dehydrogenase